MCVVVPSMYRCVDCVCSARAVDDVRARLHLDKSERQCAELVLQLITESRANWRSQLLDSYQRILNDIH